MMIGREINSRGRRTIRVVSALAFAVATRGQNLLVLALLVAATTPASVATFGAYSSLQAVAGYGLALSLPFVHGRLFFSGSPANDTDIVGQSIIALAIVGGLYLTLAAAASSLVGLRFGSGPTRVSLVWVTLSIFGYLASEHVVTTARVVDDSFLLLCSAATKLVGIPTIPLLMAAPVGLNPLHAVCAYVAAVSTVIVVLGVTRQWSVYKILRFRPKRMLHIFPFLLASSFAPLCQWTMAAAGRLLVGSDRPSAGPYTLYSFGLTTVSLLCYAVYDANRSRLFGLWNPQTWTAWRAALIGTNIICASVYLSAAVFGLVFWPIWNAFFPSYHLPNAWQPYFVATLIAGMFNGGVYWTALAARRLSRTNVATGLGAVIFLLVLILQSDRGSSFSYVRATAISSCVQALVGIVLLIPILVSTGKQSGRRPAF